MFSRFQVCCRQAACSLKAGAKIQPFSKPPKFFFNYFLSHPTTGRTTSALRPEFFFRSNRKILKNRPAKDKKNPFFSPFLGSRKVIICENLCILLSMCGLNTYKYCGNKTEEYAITLFSSALHRYFPSEGEKDYFVLIRENLLSGTPHVRIPVHPTTGWGAFQYGSADAWWALPGTPPRDEKRLYGKNGVSLHPISGETR